MHEGRDSDVIRPGSEHGMDGWVGGWMGNERKGERDRVLIQPPPPSKIPAVEEEEEEDEKGPRGRANRGRADSHFLLPFCPRYAVVGPKSARQPRTSPAAVVGSAVCGYPAKRTGRRAFSFFVGIPPFCCQETAGKRDAGGWEAGEGEGPTTMHFLRAALDGWIDGWIAMEVRAWFFFGR